MSKALVAVNKVELLEGEELMDLAKKVMAAITQNKGKIGKSLAAPWSLLRSCRCSKPSTESESRR